MASVNQHVFQLHNYKRPTFCEHCGGLLVGVMRQGLRCKRCETDVHEKCVEDLEKKCVEMVVGQHNFREKTYKQPTYCDYCTKLLVGVVNQGVKCSECSTNVHEKCRDKVETECKKGAAKAGKKQGKQQSPPNASAKEQSPGFQRARGSRRTFRGAGRGKPDDKVSFVAMDELEEATRENEETDGSTLFATMPEKSTPNSASPSKRPAASESQAEHTSGYDNSSQASTSKAAAGGNANVRQIDDAVQKVVDIMKDNSMKINERCDKIEVLEEKSFQLKESARIFEDNAQKIQRKMWLKNKKVWIVLGVVLLLLIIVIAVSVVFANKKKTS